MWARNLVPWKNMDVVTFSICLGLAAIGWLLVYRVGYDTGAPETMGSFLSTAAGKQTMWMFIAMALFWLTILIDAKFWQTFAYAIYGISVGLLVLVLIFGTTIKGATSWFTLPGLGISIQPSEIAKFGTCLGVSSFLSQYSTNLRQFKSQVIALGLILTPMALVLLQPDAGSALVFASFLLVFYRQGFPGYYYLVGAFLLSTLLLGFIFPPLYVLFGLVLAADLILAFHFRPQKISLTAGIIAAGGLITWQYLQPERLEPLITAAALFSVSGFYLWGRKGKGRLIGLLMAALVIGSGMAFAASYALNEVLKPHQQERIKVWLNPEEADPRGARYNLEQSKLAISSGGLYGKGLFKGTMTRLNYVPEQTTDFIFCTVGEEQGFLGSFALIILYLILLFRITVIAERQRTLFARSYAYSVAGIFFIHFFINIGMTMGLMPIIGIPLPFISKGGSSLLGFTLMVAVLLKLDRSRKEILGKIS